MPAKSIPWRRRPKIKNLQGDMTSAMSFAVVANSEQFSKKLHAYRVLTFLKELGSVAYPVSPELDKLGKIKVFAKLSDLPESIDVVIPCLPETFSLTIVKEAKDLGIKKVWFQQKTLSLEAEQFCQDNDIEIIEGCTLMYKDFDSLLKYVNPCFWHYKTFTKKQK